ncbi:MAG: MaoC family dehydratase [Actinomycetota bacterium]
MPVTQPQVGDELPVLEIPITPTLIISGAIASRDYQDVHHDATLAKKRGSKDIFMNILTTNGLVARFVTDWTGPESRLRKISIRLGVPTYPGDTMRLTGRVASVNERVIEIEVKGSNEIGDHVTGTVSVEL